MLADQKELPELIRQMLHHREPKRILDAPPHYRHAAVLMPIVSRNGSYKVLFTKRADTLEHHKGQISFPGGAEDAEDNSRKETALREAYEEIGLEREDVEILGRIDDTMTLESSFIVHPFVGLIQSPYDFIISEKEVDRIIKVPWDDLVSSHMERKTCSVERNGKIFQTPTFEYNGDVIWGATAKIMANFLDIYNQEYHFGT